MNIPSNGFASRAEAIRFYMQRIEKLEEVLTGTVEALEYAVEHGLDNPSINGHLVLQQRLTAAKGELVRWRR